MLLLFIILQVSSAGNDHKTRPIPKSWITTSVDNPSSTTTIMKPYVCKDGSRPESPTAVISKCRAAFLGLPSDTEWYNPSPGVLMRRQGPCYSTTQWGKRFGGNNKWYDDADYLSNGRPRKGAKPCRADAPWYE